MHNEIEYLERCLAKATNEKARWQYHDLIRRQKEILAKKAGA